MVKYRLSVIVLIGLIQNLGLANDERDYVIDPEGQYTFLSGLGVDGCSPSSIQCDFGISGTIAVDFDGDNARLLGSQLQLSGNEFIQNNPPSFIPVTADSVEHWLFFRSFGLISGGATPSVYEDREIAGLVLTRFPRGSISLAGGYNDTLVDGDGIQFNFSAVPLPNFLGDYNLNDVVDAADYTVWLQTLGATVTLGTGADGHPDGVIDRLDYMAWKNSIGQLVPFQPYAGDHDPGSPPSGFPGSPVPEPCSLFLLCCGAALMACSSTPLRISSST